MIAQSDSFLYQSHRNIKPILMLQYPCGSIHLFEHGTRYQATFQGLNQSDYIKAADDLLSAAINLNILSIAHPELDRRQKGAIS
jgi:hypothetical protein